jgi:hypothetical protein
MRRLLQALAPLACAAALAAAGCGDDDGSSGPIDSALAYVPEETPFAVAIETDVDGDQYQAVDAIVGRFPGSDSIKESLRRELERTGEGVSFNDDVRPLLGNPFVVAAIDVASFVSDSDDTDFVAALEVEDQDALDSLIDKTSPEERGEVAGATVYEDDGTLFAVEGDMVVFGASSDLLDAALERADGDDHLDPESFEDSLEGLPDEALARVYVDLQALIEQDPEAAPAREIEWIGALRTLGMTLTAQDDAVDVDLNLRTGGDLSEGDLPLATGDETPEVDQRPGEIAVGVRDPSRLIEFFESAFQTADPSGYGEYEAGKRALAARLDLDVERDVYGQLTGDLSISTAVSGAFSARAEVADPGAFARTVDRLADALPQLGAGLGVVGVRPRGDLYEARLRGGGRFVFGLAGDAFVVASDAARARRLASAQPTPVENASGSVVLAADAEQVAGQVLRQLAPQMGIGGVFGAGLLTRPLEDLRGSLATSTDGMRGRVSLTLD